MARRLGRRPCKVRNYQTPSEGSYSKAFGLTLEFRWDLVSKRTLFKTKCNCIADGKENMDSVLRAQSELLGGIFGHWSKSSGCLGKLDLLYIPGRPKSGAIWHPSTKIPTSVGGA
jgi:hypothetical protein